MRRHRSYTTVLVATAALAGSSVLAPAGAVAAGAADGKPGSSVTFLTIPGDGGTPLKAGVVRPTGRGNGPFPLLVMPASWSCSDIEYIGVATRLAAERGYVIVSYTTRGFWESGGEVEIGGPADTRDTSRVIDWALANTAADRNRIGLAGISYGAGIGLLAAARDPRVKAVSAMAAWSDLTASLYPNRTLNEHASMLLLSTGNAMGRPGRDMQRVQDAYFRNEFEPVLAMARPRSPINQLKQLNAHRPAILITGGWLDGVFPPGQLPAFYAGLRGPKMLMLQPGDHGTAELPGALGTANDAWAATTRWFDHYLKGVDNGIDRQPPVRIKTANGGGWTGFRSWSAMGPKTLRYRLGPAERLAPSGKAAASAAGRSRRITGGAETVADSGIIGLSGINQQAGVHRTARIAQVDRRLGAVWSTAPLARTTVIGGSAVLRTTVTPSAKDTSLFGYLYDVAPNGEGSLITHMPYTLRGVRPGRPYRIEVRMQPTRWRVPAGHRLSLVVDTMDGRYRSTSVLGSTVTFGDSTRYPSALTVPVGAP